MQQHAQDVGTLILRAEVMEATLKGFWRQCEAVDSGRGPPLSYPGVIRVRRGADEQGGTVLIVM